MTSTLGGPVRRMTLRREIYDRVRAALLAGEIGQDERLTETALAEQLGTSRAPVREALRELEQEGLIVSLGYRGYSPPPATTEDVRELSRLRVALERLAIGLAVERATPEDFDSLRAILSDMAAAVAAGDTERASEVDAAFHEKICEVAKHALLVRMWSSMRAQLAIAMRVVNLSHPRLSGLVERHALLLEVLESGDVAAAELAMEEHIHAGLGILNGSSTDDVRKGS